MSETMTARRADAPSRIVAARLPGRPVVRADGGDISLMSDAERQALRGGIGDGAVIEGIKPLPVPEPDPLSGEAIAWDDHAVTSWTPDLVHHRLVGAGEILARMPNAERPAGYAAIRIVEDSDAPPKVRPSAQEISMCEATIDTLGTLGKFDRAVAFGFMLGMGARKVAAQIAKFGLASPYGGKSHMAVHHAYKALRDRLALRWNGVGMGVDGFTRDRYLAWKDREGKNI